MRADQLPALRELHSRGLANGVDVTLIDEGELADLEPLARTIGTALWSPTTAVADPLAVVEALAGRVRERGGRIHLETEVSGGGLDQETLNRIAGQAKEQCPVSVLLKPGLESLTLDVRLK